MKQNKPWFDEECLGFLDQRKRSKMQWIQDPIQSNVHNLNNVRREVSRHLNLLILFGKRRNCLNSGWNRFIRSGIKQIVTIIGAYQFCKSLTKFYQLSCSQGSFHMRRKLSEIINVAFDATGRLLIIYSAFAKHLRKNENTMKKSISSS